MKVRAMTNSTYLWLALFSLATQCRADLIVSATTEESGGTWTYTYTVDNTTGTEWAWDFLLSGLSSGTIGGSPTGWDPTSTATTAGWNAPVEANWVDPSASLSGYVLTSPYAPATVSWAVETDADDNFFTLDGSTLTGTVVGPSVPEPATLPLFALGLGVLLSRRRNRVRRQGNRTKSRGAYLGPERTM